MNRAPELLDPRGLSDFQPSLMPLCDGEEAPPRDTSDRALRRVIEFASLYYRMNLAVTCGETARLAGDKVQERIELEKLLAASRLRDSLEDRYAPEGFLA